MPEPSEEQIVAEVGRVAMPAFGGASDGQWVLLPPKPSVDLPKDGDEYMVCWGIINGVERWWAQAKDADVDAAKIMNAFLDRQSWPTPIPVSERLPERNAIEIGSSFVLPAFLVYDPKYYQWITGFYNHDEGQWFHLESTGHAIELNPTHWLPQPPPPA